MSEVDLDPAQTVQVQGIGNHEVSVYAAIHSLLPCDRQCGLSHIDSQDVQPQRGNLKGVLACPASCVQNCAGECAFARQAQYRWLWLADVPGWRTIDAQQRLIAVVALGISSGQITSISSVVNPDKLAHLGPLGDFRSLLGTES